jgi:glycerophosphoryl diester phosphodiesterase
MLIIGHRGASAAHPENTLAAFSGAAEQGADGIELDLRRTRDGAVVVRHDPTLPDGRLLLDLQRHELPDWMPTLDEVLDACSGFSVVNLEIKNWPGDPDFDPAELVAERVVEAVAARPEVRDQVLVTSFHLPTIDRVQRLDPQLRTGWLTINLPDPGPMLDALAARRHRAVHPHVAFVDPALVDASHAVGLELNAWTVDDPGRIRALASMGVDGAITNVPGAARAALAGS